MITVTAGNNLNRHPYIIDEHTTLKKCFEDAEVNYNVGLNSLDGSTLKPGDLNKTFADFGYDGSEGHDACYLLNVVKTDNA